MTTPNRMTMTPHKTTLNRMTRRETLKVLGAAAGAGVFTLPARAKAATGGKVIRVGIIADIHQDVMHDGERRLTAFIEAMGKERPDFIVQMGDFCIPIEANRPFVDIWNRFDGPRYHLLGNHDMDGDGKVRHGSYGFTKEETMAFWGDMRSRYYSFDVEGLHFVVLDGNDKAEQRAPGYYRYVLPDQAKWLADDLAATKLPTFVMIHQSLERADGGVENQQEIRALMEQANRDAGWRKVIACFSGHHHRDYVRRINGIIYPQINSASYYWVGGKFQHQRYSAEIDAGHPYIKYTVPYKDPLWAMLTIDTNLGYMRITGRESEFVGPAPWELGKTREQWEAQSLRPGISGWKIPL